MLLWFSRHGQDFDTAACAAALGMSEPECVGCLNYWVEKGILCCDGVAVAAPAESAPVKQARPAAVKPVWKEVIAYQQEHKEFNAFLQEVSARLGRPLNHGDNATLLYLITTAGLSQTSVLLATAYAVSIDKASMRYIESLVLGWVDEDIVTPEQVDAKIRELTETRAAAEKVEKVLGLTRPLNAAQAKTAHKWLTVWCFSDAMLQHAQTLTLENCDKFSPAYMDKILERWHAEGIHTCLDTSGCILTEEVKTALALTDRVLLDVKYTTDEDDRETVVIRVDFLEYPSSRVIKLFFLDKDTVLLRNEDLPGKALIKPAVKLVVDELPDNPLVTGVIDKIGLDYLEFKVGNAFASELLLKRK